MGMHRRGKKTDDDKAVEKVIAHAKGHDQIMPRGRHAKRSDGLLSVRRHEGDNEQEEGAGSESNGVDHHDRDDEHGDAGADHGRDYRGDNNDDMEDLRHDLR